MSLQTGVLKFQSGDPSPTISNHQAAANVARPGDAVAIEAGVYHETVKPAFSGTAGAPILTNPTTDSQLPSTELNAIYGVGRFPAARFTKQRNRGIWVME